MRRIVTILIVAMVLPTISVSANSSPFDFFIDDDVVIHPDETVQFRIAWHNIVGDERHFSIALNDSDSNLTVEGLPEDWTRVGSGRLGEMTINVTVLPNSNYETISLQACSSRAKKDSPRRIHSVLGYMTLLKTNHPNLP